jgi:dGTPase
MAPYGGFEGNAQTLRILTQTIFSEGREGMNPTRALMDGVLKYKTLQAELPDAPNHFLYNDQHAALTFAHGGEAFPTELTPGRTRNGFHSIECQVMDWADDTAYSLNDLADGIHAGFISLQTLERWAARQSLSQAEAEHIEFLCKAIREGRVEARLNRYIGLCIGACSLRAVGGWLSDKTRRYGLELHIDDAVRAQTKLNKRISHELVFQTPALQQLDHKAGFILKRLFAVLQERYIEGDGHGLHMLPQETESAIKRAADATERARLICDWIANMTDHFAFRTYRRLFDAEFGSITDLV